MDDQTLELLRKRIEQGSAEPLAPEAPTPGLNQEAIDALQRRIDTSNLPQVGVPQVREAFNPSFRQSQETGMDWEPPGIGGKAIERLLGLDVKDPLPWTRMGTTVTGTIAGAVQGSRVPGPAVVKGIGAAVGGAAGTVIGATAPETALGAAEELGLLPPGTREKYGLDDYELGILAEGELIVDAFLGGGAAAARLGVRGLNKLVTGGNAETRAMAEAANRQGIAMMPVQVGQGTVGRGFVSVFGVFPWFASALKKRGQRTMDQIQNAFDGVPARFGPLTTYDEASATILRESRATVRAINETYENGISNVIGRAAANGIVVHPTRTRRALDGIMRSFQGGPARAGEIPTTMQGNFNPRLLPPDARDLYQFTTDLQRSISEGTALAEMPIRQVETLFRTINRKIVQAAKTGDTRIMQRWEEIQQSLQSDMMTNVTSNSRNPQYTPRQFVEEMHHYDVEMTGAINELFRAGRSAASKLGFEASPTGRTIIDQGLRPTQAMDNLAKLLLRDNSPGIIDEVAHLAGQDGVRQLTSAVFNDIAEKALVRDGTDNTFRFDANTFARELGLDRRPGQPTSMRYRQVERMLQVSGTDLTMENLNQLVTIARRASELNLPDVSTFVARRVALSGLKQGIAGALPIAAVSGAAGGVTSSTGIGLGAALLVSLGIKGFGTMLSNPRSARALRYVLDEEIKSVARWTAGTRAVVGALDEMVKQGTIDPEEMGIRRDAFNAVREQFQAAENGQAKK